MPRLHTLDYLRGLAAFGIMIYHYFTWSFGDYNSNDFMGRLGIYGVSIFYVISGITLFYVYDKKMMPRKDDLFNFFKKRFFRIFPLLWLVIIGSITLSRQLPDLTKLALNFTGLFGIFSWDQYLATGAWSIGNELVFYLFFPFFIFFEKKSKLLLIVFSIIIFIVYLFFAFNVLDPSQSLVSQWKNYVNPLNQLFLFLGGALIGRIFKNVKINIILNSILLISALLFFTWIPIYGDTIQLVTGFNRMIFTFCCFIICFCFYKSTIYIPPFIDKPLGLFGEISYSVYLLHPIVYAGSNFAFRISEKYIYSFPIEFRLGSCILMTLLLSYLVYEKFEKYFIRIGAAKKVLSTPSSVTLQG